MLASVLGGIGRLMVSGITLYLGDSSNHLGLANYAFYGQSVIAFGYLFVVMFGMKDVIKEK